MGRREGGTISLWHSTCMWRMHSRPQDGGRSWASGNSPHVSSSNPWVSKQSSYLPVTAATDTGGLAVPRTAIRGTRARRCWRPHRPQDGGGPRVSGIHASDLPVSFQVSTQPRPLLWTVPTDTGGLAPSRSFDRGTQAPGCRRPHRPQDAGGSLLCGTGRGLARNSIGRPGSTVSPGASVEEVP